MIQDSLSELVEVVPEVLEKVQKVRKKLHLTSDQCPCAPKESGRGCVGPVCMQEVLEKGRCKCGAFKKKSPKCLEDALEDETLKDVPLDDRGDYE